MGGALDQVEIKLSQLSTKLKLKLKLSLAIMICGLFVKCSVTRIYKQHQPDAVVWVQHSCININFPFLILS